MARSRRDNADEEGSYEESDGVEHSEVEEDEEQQQPQSVRKRQKLSLNQMRRIGNQEDIQPVMQVSVEDENEGDDRLYEPLGVFEETVLKAVRNIIMKSSTDKGIRKLNLTSITRGSVLNDIINSANYSLRHTFGLHLEESSDVKGKYYLKSSLTLKEKDILNKLWPNTQSVQQKNGRNIDSEEYFISKFQHDQLPSDNYELVKTGILSIILAVIIIENNHISKYEITKILKNFGVASDLNKINSNTNTNLESLITEFERKEYIKKESIGNKTTNGVMANVQDDHYIYYNIGDKALAEFTPESFYRLIKTVYGEEFNSIISKKAIHTIHATFKIPLEQLNFETGDVNTEPENPSPPSPQQPQPDQQDQQPNVKAETNDLQPL